MTGSKKTLFIVIGHGAINVGMDVFLRAQSLEKKDILFYVMRFSTSDYKKYKDKVPQLTTDEINYIKKHAEKRNIIIYDENSFTGTTLRKVKAFLKNKVFSSKKLNILYNLNTKNYKPNI